ncbi:MAG: glycogen synthase GlgA [Gammaproteobacteria bacterium]|nr:glycogen synthase GlgA [Gammaproteobacteria bacterium]
MRVLFASAEVYPLIKTGGLADVAGLLPRALHQLGIDIRIIMPAYPTALKRPHKHVKTTPVHISDSSADVSLRQIQIADIAVPIYLVDCPECFRRPGGPYTDAQDQEWPDNATRFGVFSKAIVELVLGNTELEWTPDVLHCNDWHTGLVPALLAEDRRRPATIFTIHNLAYQGLFSREVFESLALPEKLWHPDRLEFHDNFSFIKGGLVYADYLTTVSPTYADEIKTPDSGSGLDGLLRGRSEHLIGILNGVDYDVWDPENDHLIDCNYGSSSITGKEVNKQALQQSLELALDPDKPLIAYIGRLVNQKGIDLVLTALPQMIERLRVEIVILGSGDHKFEREIIKACTRYPGKMAAHIGFSEELAHRIEAGADMLLMPSRFEPCGLNQMYSLRYGTVPIVRAVGGLVDSVVDTDESTIENHTATGFLFDTDVAQDMLRCVERAATVYRQAPEVWRDLMMNGMRCDFSWSHSAKEYEKLYVLAGQSRENYKTGPVN